MRAAGLEDEALKSHVAKICRSPEFRSKQVLCRFLSYIVSETIAGRADDIKGFSIGVDVFNKDDDFDPGQDTLVRINAGRLRRMLNFYYSNTGKNDNIRIDIPTGGYVPHFTVLSGDREDLRMEPSPGEEGKLSLEPSIAVFSFKDLTGDPKHAYFARGFSYELMVELNRFEDLKVYNYLSVSDYPETGSRLHTSLQNKEVRFAVGGAIHGNPDRINVLVELQDLHDGKQIWTERYSEKILAENLIDIQERISREISGKLGNEYGIILRQLTLDAKKQKPRNINTYMAVLKYYNYLLQRTSETAGAAFEALNRAVKNDPGSGIALASLAAMHGTAYTLDYPGADKSYRAVGELAERAHILDTYSLFVQIVLSFKCFIYEEKERFFHLSDRILGMNPNGSLRLGSLGFHLSLYGDWERGIKILDSAMQGHLEYPRYFHGATTLFHYREKSYELALKEAKMYVVPGFFWGPLLRAAVLGQLSRKKDAQKELNRLKQIKPDFEIKARYLISRFVKEDSLTDHIIEGLQKAGLPVT